MTVSRTQLIESLVAEVTREVVDQIKSNVRARVREELGLEARAEPAASPPPAQASAPTDVPTMFRSPPTPSGERPRRRPRARVESFNIGSTRQQTIANMFKANKERVFRASEIVNLLPDKQTPKHSPERSILSALSHLNAKGCVTRVSRGKYKFRAPLRAR
jgi:hypothetical protein